MSNVAKNTIDVEGNVVKDSGEKVTCVGLDENDRVGLLYPLNHSSAEDKLRMADEILEEEPDDEEAQFEAWQFQAEGLLQQGKYEDALEKANKLCGAEAGLMTEFQLKSQILLCLGRYDESLQAAKEAQIDPEQYLAQALEAHNLIYMGKYAEANLIADFVAAFDDGMGFRLKQEVFRQMEKIELEAMNA